MVLNSDSHCVVDG